jgi:hypothetical protein
MHLMILDNRRGEEMHLNILDKKRVEERRGDAFDVMGGGDATN